MDLGRAFLIIHTPCPNGDKATRHALLGLFHGLVALPAWASVAGLDIAWVLSLGYQCIIIS